MIEVELMNEHSMKFFKSFSMFEFALKENGFLRCKREGCNAEAGWDAFVTKYSSGYTATTVACELIRLKPKRQKVSQNGDLEWLDVGVEDCSTDLEKVVRYLKTVRNNLFHGGKNNAEGWNRSDRAIRLVGASVLVLGE